MIQEQNWFCAQLGAREHYAIPRALHAKGALVGLMTDYWAGAATRKLARYVPNKVTKSLAARTNSGIPHKMVDAWNMHSIIWETQLRRMTLSGGVKGRYLAYCDVGKRFSNAVAQRMKARGKLPENSIFIGYDTSSLEVMQYLKDCGVPCILDQIDPGRVEHEMVQEEQLAWPGWQSYHLDIPDEFYVRHQNEWEIADKVIVNSDFSRDALILQGVPPSKIDIVSLSYDNFDFSESCQTEFADMWLGELSRGFSKKHPLRVLFLGQVMLRKGIQYLVKAAELLLEHPVVFDVVGPLDITENAIKLFPQNVKFYGRVTRNEVSNWYRNAHLFILPTLSDGFAITQLEAMAYGLPVISTPNCGEVVTDGVDGYLVPPRDSESIAKVIQNYIEDPTILIAQHAAALRKSKTFPFERVATSLLTIGESIHVHLGTRNSYA